jgi:hypothetical protein
VTRTPSVRALGISTEVLGSAYIDLDEEPSTIS